jgi:hypothetical protein
VDWIDGRWHDLTNAGSATWLAVAAWAAVALGIAALYYAHRQIQRNRQLNAERLRPHVVMFMEPNASDWHIIELIVKNFGQAAAHNVRFSFLNPPTVARYEEGYHNSFPQVDELQLPGELPVLAPDQDWRTVWDSALDRGQLGEAIDSRFVGAVTYYDRPPVQGSRFGFGRNKRRQFTSKVILDWNELQPVDRLELLTSHDLAKRERSKLELLRSLLTYFHYATRDASPQMLRAEIERINRATEETHDRRRTQHFDEPTVHLQLAETDSPAGSPVGRHSRNSN